MSSKNTPDFCIHNQEYDENNPDCQVERHRTKDFVDTYMKDNRNPKFPRNWRIQNIEHVLDDSTITYENISYAVDTPKANDYVVMSNLRCRIDLIKDTAH